jgi:hypothetical protein
LADRRGRQIRQQLRQISLRIDAVPAAGDVLGSERHDDRRRRRSILDLATIIIAALIGSGTFAKLIPLGPTSRRI